MIVEVDGGYRGRDASRETPGEPLRRVVAAAKMLGRYLDDEGRTYG
jgi:hypothetical protein